MSCAAQQASGGVARDSGRSERLWTHQPRHPVFGLWDGFGVSDTFFEPLAEDPRTRQVWLKNPENLTGKQREKLDGLDRCRSNLTRARAYRIRLAFQDHYKQPAHLAEEYLDKWYYWATHSRLKPVVDAAKTIRRHLGGNPT